MSRIRRFKVNKLIRDKIPEITLIEGVTTFIKKLEEVDYLKSLHNKLIEE